MGTMIVVSELHASSPCANVGYATKKQSIEMEQTSGVGINRDPLSNAGAFPTAGVPLPDACRSSKAAKPCGPRRQVCGQQANACMSHEKRATGVERSERPDWECVHQKSAMIVKSQHCQGHRWMRRRPLRIR